MACHGRPRSRCGAERAQEQLTGSPFGNSEFNQSIKRAVPEGHTFKVRARLVCLSEHLCGCGSRRTRVACVQRLTNEVPVRAHWQGYPICFSHMSPALMMTALRQAHVAVDIMKVRRAR